ncbi:MAG: type II secretion system F family protein [Bowdeniella nasicola]|nr:type II secretion system F family protein [Bowdeniella nasicola]
MSIGYLAVIVGVTAGVGLLLLVLAYDAARPTLVRRLAPALDVRERGRAQTSISAVEALIAAAGRDLGRAVGMIGSSTSSVRERLRTLGREEDVGQIRTEQLASAALGVGLVLLATPLLLARAVPGLIIVALALMAAVGGALARDTWLSIQVRRYRAQLVRQLPDIVELLALAISAGEGPLAALTRVCDIGTGELAARLRATLAAVHAGAPLAQALRELSEGNAVPALRRFSESMVTALERGTPLAAVLHAIAQDLRAEARESLMESGGKREIGMLVPVVFLILPVSVIFALYPGLHALNAVMT